MEFQTKATKDLKDITTSLSRTYIIARNFSKIVMASKTTENTRLTFVKTYSIL